MKINHKLPIIILFILFFIFSLYSSENLTSRVVRLKLKEIARSKCLYDLREIKIISDMGVDDRGNVCILDAATHQILKLDKNLNLLKSIKKRGQGPGEFFNSWRLSVDRSGEVYLYDGSGKLIRYSEELELIKEIKPGVSSLRVFEAVNLTGNILLGRKFNMETGGNIGIMFNILEKKVLTKFDIRSYPNYGIKVGNGYLAPTIKYLGSHVFIGAIDNYCVIGEGEPFDVRLYNALGEKVCQIKKNYSRIPLKKNEIDYLADEVTLFLGSRFKKQDVKKAIEYYQKKNIIHKILLDFDKIYVFLVPPDITKKEQFPVEIYDFKGKLIRQAMISNIPRLIRSNLFYLIEENDEEEPTILVKYKLLN